MSVDEMSVDEIVRRLAGEMFHADRILDRALRSAGGPDRAWAEHCAERARAQHARVSALLAAAPDPQDAIEQAERLLGGRRAPCRR